MNDIDDSRERVALGRSPLIAAEDLAGMLGRSDVKIFDVRGTWSTPARALPEDYQAEHIQGAAFLDWTKHFIEEGVPLGLASVADEAGARDAFEALGIDEGDPVVLYDDYAHMQAGRIWLAMRHWGFDTVRVLNGGWTYWKSLNLPVTSDVPARTTGTFQPKKQDGLKIDLDMFLKTYGQACLIDARGPAGYAGKPDDPRTGHIPGAISAPFSSVLDPDTGLFLDSDRIARVLDESAPTWREKPIIASCGSGYAATTILLALAGLDQPATLFDGSFAAWKQDPSRPIEQGDSARS